MLKSIATTYASLTEAFPRFAKLARYVISGGTGAFTNLLVLYMLVHFWNVWYITAAIVAFLFAFVVSFVLQKFWTFNDKKIQGAHVQALWYVAIALINLGVNTVLLYFLVDKFNINYLVSQIIASALVACESFFVYRIIFKAQKEEAVLTVNQQ